MVPGSGRVSLGVSVLGGEVPPARQDYEPELAQHAVMHGEAATRVHRAEVVDEIRRLQPRGANGERTEAITASDLSAVWVDVLGAQRQGPEAADRWEAADRRRSPRGIGTRPHVPVLVNVLVDRCSRRVW